MVYLVLIENFLFVLGLILRTTCLMKVIDFYDTDDGVIMK